MTISVLQNAVIFFVCFHGVSCSYEDYFIFTYSTHPSDRVILHWVRVERHPRDTRSPPPRLSTSKWFKRWWRKYNFPDTMLARAVALSKSRTMYLDQLEDGTRGALIVFKFMTQPKRCQIRTAWGRKRVCIQSHIFSLFVQKHKARHTMVESGCASQCWASTGTVCKWAPATGDE